MVNIRTRDVFVTMRPDMEQVEARLEEAAHIDFPAVSDLVLGLVRAGGKRLRPLILLLAGRAYGYDREPIFTAGAGVELLHTASLVHDDTVDRAALRRGRPTLNSMLSSGAVILLGDYLFAQSARRQHLRLDAGRYLRWAAARNVRCSSPRPNARGI
jgi:geranylgeranyl pyrophosphate synthase